MFFRYESSRPRTASYSSRSGSQVGSAVPSPGTPGSVTPRNTTRSSRLPRYSDYYPDTTTEYPERRFRSYDEFSQGSAASHDEEYIYTRESPHIDIETSRNLPSVVIPPENHQNDRNFAPPDIRHLQKERVHLLEQLEDCPSSGDELMSPKKRLKIDIDGGDDLNHTEHRKISEVRRLSDVGLKHHSRRPSMDGKHSTILVERSTYLPHTICKRRKTSGSEGERRLHHHEISGGESLSGSRPGTPLCDERPENLPPSEPRRLPRERSTNEGPLSLPLPRFAAQVLNCPRISVAGFKGKESSPPTLVTSPKVSGIVPPSPVHVPPPASPPPRPPSSSNSSDSDVPPPSPSLEERLKSLDEKYEKWSGSRALSAASGDALAKLDASASERFKFRHKLLDLDLKEVQPSEIVKSVLAKRSVFDEDLKRLENYGEKYEPRDFNTFSRSFSSLQTNLSVNTTQNSVSNNSLIQKPLTLTSPRSVQTSISTAKGLQYPFPSHPPISTPQTPTTVNITMSTSTHLTSNIHINDRLRQPNLTSDRTNNVKNLNRSVSQNSNNNTNQINSSLLKSRSLDSKNDISSDKLLITNIPNNSINNSENNVNNSDNTNKNQTNKLNKKDNDKCTDKNKLSDKCEKVLTRRESVSNSPSTKTDCDKKAKEGKKHIIFLKIPSKKA